VNPFDVLEPLLLLLGLVALALAGFSQVGIR
jgi:hypothetical protein